MIPFWMILLCAFSMGGGEGDDPVPPAKADGIRLSLRQAIYLALRHNLDIEVARFQPWIDDQSLLASLGAFDFTLYATGSGGENLIPTASLLSGAPVLDQDTFVFTLGVRKTLPVGVLLDLSYTTDRLHTNSSFSSLDPRWQQSFGLSVTVPILKGAGVTSNYSSILIARNTREISVYDFEKSLTETIYAVHQAYWGLVFAIGDQKVKRQALAVARKLRDENARKFQRGIVKKLDVTQAEANVASREEGIYTAEAAVLNAMDKLKRMVDPALLRLPGKVWPSDLPRGYDERIDEVAAVDRAFATALRFRPDYGKIKLQVDSQDITIEKSERDLLPKVNLTGRAFLNGLDDAFGSANSNAFKGDTRELTVGLEFEYPLGNRAARGTLRGAELTKRRLLLTRRNLEDQILVEVREAVRAIRTNEKRIDATRKARILAQERFEQTLRRQEMGLDRTFDVLAAQEDLTTAETNELKAVIDYRTSLVNLERVTGTLLSRGGIRVKEALLPRTGWEAP